MDNHCRAQTSLLLTLEVGFLDRPCDLFICLAGGGVSSTGALSGSLSFLGTACREYVSNTYATGCNLTSFQSSRKPFSLSKMSGHIIG